ncbi:MAG: ABC transporter ATP-binding protein [Chloroflexi bacterium]|nr:ABC transporter ATP-binding protein [Chloroflexota bacterium]
MLTVEELSVAYDDVTVLRQVSFQVNPGEIIALVGANGAGKTTALRAISGLVHARAGRIRFNGARIEKMRPHHIVEAGLVHVPEGRKIFPSMTVRENLELGSFIRQARPKRRESMEWVFHLLPRLKEREAQVAGTMSGGEQQMLAIGRALMARPKLLMLDEPSLGLAPLIVRDIFNTVLTINAQGVTVVIVEQNVSHTLAMAHRGYVLENGEIVLEGKGRELLSNEVMKKAYLGM